MPDTPDLSALAAILAKRTPGEWTFKHERFRAACIYASDRNVILEDNGLHADNAAAIVAAVNAIGPLLERVRSLEKDNERLRGLVHNSSNHAAGW